jgi:hypothetical protein
MVALIGFLLYYFGNLDRWNDIFSFCFGPFHSGTMGRNRVDTAKYFCTYSEWVRD